MDDKLDTLARTVGYLTWAYDVADELAGEDLLSPWADTACSIDLVAAWLQRHLSDVVEPIAADDVPAALAAARDGLLELEPHGELTTGDLVIARTWIATAITRAGEASQ